MKLWIDDVRPAPATDYIWVKSVNEAKRVIIDAENMSNKPRLFDCDFRFTLLDIDHDAGQFAPNGGDYIKLLDWLEETGRNYPIHIHSQNVVGRMNMEAICRRNGWTIVK